MRTLLLRLSRLIGNSLLYGSIFALITGSIAYAATGTKMIPNFLSSGVDFMSFFSNSGDGTAGIDARSYYTRVNGSWLGYPGDSKNYLRGGTFLSGSIYDEDDSAYYLNPNGTSQFNTMSGKTICLNGDCINTWPVSATSVQEIIENINYLNTKVRSISRSVVLESLTGSYILPRSVPDYIFCDSGGVRLIGMLYAYNQASSYVTYLVGSFHQVVYNYATNTLTNQYGTCSFPS